VATWLMKSEPDSFSIDDLKARKREPWDGVRNFQARNYMWKQMVVGDRVLFYHSNCKVPGVVGLAKVASKPYPDPSQFDAASKYFDSDSAVDNPRWWLVDVAFVKKFRRVVSLDELRTHADELNAMALLQKGSRLSVQPVSDEHAEFILGLV
jgi:predicted RNA-binding protein with PUA-like domain